jgi:hypothetical protein
MTDFVLCITLLLKVEISYFVPDASINAMISMGVLNLFCAESKD